MSSLTSIALTASFMAGLGVVLASLLALAHRKLYVYEDPRIEEVEDMLPGTNCGACGTPSCRQFALALIDSEADPGECTVSTRDQATAIADFLGVAVGEHEKRVARLACAGGNHVALNRAQYHGMETCRAAALVSGGGKGCSWGCLGLGDCADVCDLDAIHMNVHGLPEVIDERCTACNDCVEVCPKQLFSLQPVSHHLWVACKNQGFGDAEEALCDVICNACGRCVADSPEDLIQIKNHLAVIDYAKNNLASQIAMERCPTGAIVWLDEHGHGLKGSKAKKILRTRPRV